MAQPGAGSGAESNSGQRQSQETQGAEEHISLTPLPPFKPNLFERAWASVPHPTLPLLATTHNKTVTVFSLSTLSSHSTLTGGHERSIRTAAWRPGLPPHNLCLVTGSFDATSGLWRYDQDVAPRPEALEVEVTSASSGNKKTTSQYRGDDDEPDDDGKEDAWEFTLVLEGPDNEIKSVAFSPSGQYLATCSRDKSVWIWEDVGASQADDEWETVAVLNDHDGDVKCVAWCPDVPGRSRRRNVYSPDVLASASYDNTVRIWREDGDAEWVCVAVLEGHDETVWGVQFEPNPVRPDRFPRLMTWSADRTIRIWTLQEEAEDENDGTNGGAAVPMALGGIPNRMRQSLREEWVCTAVLPAVHTRDIYSASWSAVSRLVASTGSDGIIAVYREEQPEDTPMGGADDQAQAAPEQGGETTAVASNGDAPGQAEATSQAKPPASHHWNVVSKKTNGHDAYEINHITWCRRFDPGTESKGIEEMLVTTGDDGLIRPWQISPQQLVGAGH